jgi:hypothetical protein
MDNRFATVTAIFLVAMICLGLYPNVYAWASAPQINHSQDASGNTILSIQFSFAQMSDPPTSGHHPTDFQVRTSNDGSTWTEMAPVPLSPIPATTVFTVTYNLGHISGQIQVEARLNCVIHGWSDWAPNPPIAIT